MSLSLLLTVILTFTLISQTTEARTLPLKLTSNYDNFDDTLIYLWPLPSNFTHGNTTITIDPNLSLEFDQNRLKSAILIDAFQRYREVIFKRNSKSRRNDAVVYDVSLLKIVVKSKNESLNLGVDESYSLYVSKQDQHSIIGEATIEANTVYGALRGLETFSQLCTFNYETKTVEVNKAPWYIQDKPRFVFRGLLLDTSRHYLPTNVIKKVIESMSYAKLNSSLAHHRRGVVSFGVPSYPNLWKGSYSKWERYTVEDAYDIVNFAKKRVRQSFELLQDIFLGRSDTDTGVGVQHGINIMAEIDIPGHAESW
ncbi:hypothetical protein GIB67_038970 [Kingdonia uniflora]|uniref:beta-N-acetylhexosaminidase n=1 Tax=Kingdonia uniflora TaxID=39325 RepID=A0A7J7L1E7_9MAGN|nr:hypothetical protein GIB67_038970 [Kingdonia uniflora]